MPPIGAGMDALVVLARYRAAVVQANKNLKDTSACMADLGGQDAR
jgi:hypothetical protein